MSVIFEKLDEQAEKFKDLLYSNSYATDEDHSFGWENKVFHNAYIRRAHLDIIDLRDTKKLYMMHLCVFPKVWDSTPIYGVDIIAGPNKLTGAFLDYSPVSEEVHPLSTWFEKQTQNYNWVRERPLPEWAASIFSKDMVAVSNINSILELESFLELSYNSLEHYLTHIDRYQEKIPYSEKSVKETYKDRQNYYCQKQKQNPHTPRVLEALGFEPELIQRFIQTGLFPEI